MNKRILSSICLALLICNSLVNVYAVTKENENNKVNVTENNNQFVIINETVEIDSNINMTLYLDNIPYDNFTFKLYSNNSLEDVNTKDIDIKNYNNEEITFDYCINCSSLKTIVLNYKLPASVIIGDKITFNIELSNKDNPLETMSHRATITVIDSLKKEEDEKKEEKNTKEKSTFPSNINFSNKVPSSSTKSSSSTKYNGSSNNYLSNISIKGYSLNKNFIKERLTYFVTVPNNVKSLNISTTKENSKSTVNISGNSNFSVGLNKVLITVTSEDGRIKNYRIYVTRLDSDLNEKEN